MVRRFLTRVLMVILIGCCGYNWLQMRQLQAEVNGLNQRLAVRAPKPEPSLKMPSALDWRTLQSEAEKLRGTADALWREANAAQKTQGAHKGKIP